MSVFLFLIIVAIVLGLIGAVAAGLVWLLAIGCVVLAADLVYGWLLLRGRVRAPGRRGVR
jgi:hypothetical protein